MQNQNPPRYCRVHDHLTSDQFGCEPAYFDKYIKDRDLLICFEYKNMLQVMAPDGDQWGVDASDVYELKEEAAA
jgi:hypothetical protein